MIRCHYFTKDITRVIKIKNVFSANLSGTIENYELSSNFHSEKYNSK